MSINKVIQGIQNLENSENHKLTPEEIEQFLNGYIFDEFLFDTIKNTFKIGLWYLDLQTSEVHITKNAYSILGIKPEQFNNDFIKALNSIVHPDYVQYVNQFITNKNFLLHGEGITLKIMKDNNTFSWITFKGQYLNNNNDSCGAVGIMTDITDIIAQKESVSKFEHFLNTVFETVPTPIYHKDLDGRYQNYNRAFLEFLGVEQDDILGKKSDDLFSYEKSLVISKKDKELLDTKSQQVFDTDLDNTVIGTRKVRFYRDVLYDENKNPNGIVASMYDITESHEKELKLNRMNQLLQSLIEVSQAVLEINTMKDLFDLVLTKAFDTISASDFGCVLINDNDDNLTIISEIGYSKEESQGFSIKLQESYSYTFANGNLTSPIIINNIQQIISNFPDTLSTEHQVKVSSTLCTPIIIDGKIFALVNVDSKSNNVFDDYDVELMTLLKNQVELVIRNMGLYQQVVQISQTDPLTGLYNRGYFETCIDDIIKKAHRYNESFSLIIFDLNNLKLVNDLMGHNIGDRYITSFASMFNNYIRNSDIVARFGGDEFIAVFFNGDSECIKNRMDIINHEFMAQQIAEIHHIKPSFSYGIAEFPKDSTEYNELVRIADERMYHNKRYLKSKMISSTTD